MRDILKLRAAHVKETKVRVTAMQRDIARCGVSQRMLAIASGMQQPHINRVLRGHVRRPNYWTLERLETAIAHFLSRRES